MRLLHAETLEFKEFLNPEDVKYAIISHRWTDEEVSYEDFPTYRSGTRQGYGWTKIEHACRLASTLLIEWVWMDTCCIDKKSSAELSEAINSMFQWYRKSLYCLVFLRDVESISSVRKTLQFSQSEWFTRGWTLQELIAPDELLFYDSSFRCIGSKRTLMTDIIKATGIKTASWNRTSRDFPSASDLDSFCVAERMGWMSRRTTTRKEDAAYCLLGIFGVNISLIYGEGEEKAFVRLQMEIIRKSTDETIFVWSRTDDNPDWYGLLAPSAKCFWTNNWQRYASSTAKTDSITTEIHRSPFAMTNQGLHMTLRLPRGTGMFDMQEHETRPIRLPLNAWWCVYDHADIYEEQVVIWFHKYHCRANILTAARRIDKLRDIDAQLSVVADWGEGDKRDMLEWEVYFPQSGL